MSETNNHTALPSLQFERNHFFYGKLITTRDMTDEQAYFNEKRWLLNRLLFGSGIVCGLEVTAQADNKTIEIAPGVALDGLGREIVITDKKKIELKELAGLDIAGLADGATKSGFLCLAYDECPREPLPTLRSTACDEVCDFNRIRESFQLRWSDEDGQSIGEALCEKKVASAEATFVKVERIAPVWVREGEVFEVAIKVTAKQFLSNVRATEFVTGGQLIDPNPTVPNQTSQFPTPPVNLQAGEFFAYVYQVRAGSPGPAQMKIKPQMTGLAWFLEEIDRPGDRLPGGDRIPPPVRPISAPALETTIEIVDGEEAEDREAERRRQISCQTTGPLCITLAALEVKRKDGVISLTGAPGTRNLRRFRYSLEHLANLFECVRTQILAAPDSPRPGHAFITFNDLSQDTPKPVGSADNAGHSFTASHGDHSHALPLKNEGGLKFLKNAQVDELCINGDVDGDRINFLKTVSGQNPTEPQHLTTKTYVDSKIAGLDWQESVKDKDLTAPPPNPPAEGDRYLIFTANPTGAWSPGSTAIVAWNGSAWEFTFPDEGTAIFVEDENIAYLFVDNAWIPFLATPTVTAGGGLKASGAVISVGKGIGIIVNPDDVQVDFESSQPAAIGSPPGPGAKDTVARGDHSHALPLPPNGGLVFDGRDYRIEGEIGGENISFLSPIFGRNPMQPSHLATKQYVDDKVASVPIPTNSLIANGVARFDLSLLPPLTREVVSGSIDPELGSGPICVLLGIEFGKPELILTGDFTDLESTAAQNKIFLAALVAPTPSGSRNNSTFSIFVRSGDRPEVGLPNKFRVRYWVFKPSNDREEIEFKPRDAPV